MIRIYGLRDPDTVLYYNKCCYLLLRSLYGIALLVVNKISQYTCWCTCHICYDVLKGDRKCWLNLAFPLILGARTHLLRNRVIRPPHTSSQQKKELSNTKHEGLISASQSVSDTLDFVSNIRSTR